MLDDAVFHEKADMILEALQEAVEGADESGEIDVEYVEGILTIKLADGNEYVLNKHEPSRQIWASSPFSGAAKFNYEEDEDEWLSKGGHSLREFMFNEFDKNVGLDVEF